jgi:hypothetical protein
VPAPAAARPAEGGGAQVVYAGGAVESTTFGTWSPAHVLAGAASCIATRSFRVARSLGDPAKLLTSIMSSGPFASVHLQKLSSMMENDTWWY